MKTLSPLLYSLAQASSPRLVLALRPQDPLPDWISHVIRLGSNFQVIYQGSKDVEGLGAARSKATKQSFIGMSYSTFIIFGICAPDVAMSEPRGVESAPLTASGTGSLKRVENIIPQRGLIKAYQHGRSLPGSNHSMQQLRAPESREGIPMVDADVPVSINEVLVAMQDICVRYGDKEILGSWEQQSEGQTRKGLSWTVRRGERWGVFGPNGKCLALHEGAEHELTGTRIWKDDTHLFNLL